MNSSTFNTKKVWDVVIVGAGPAGALAAYLLSRGKQTVLLLDQADFPRKKVCGGCFSSRSIDLLEIQGLGHLFRKMGAEPFHTIRVTSGRVSAKIPVPQGVSLSREKFDFALIQEAQKQGAVFLAKTKAKLINTSNGFARIHASNVEGEFEITAGMAIVSDGLSGTCLSDFSTSDVQISQEALIGLSTSIDGLDTPCEAGFIEMICGEEGYVGIARNEDQRLEIAAAIRPDRLKLMRSPAKIIMKILREAGVSWTDQLEESSWQGTPTFRRMRKTLAGHRYFVLGDSAGFVEPFTGEGIYWAMLQAVLISELLEMNQFQWNEKLTRVWPQVFRKHIAFKQARCLWLTRLLRSPVLCKCAVLLSAWLPALSQRIVCAIHGPNRLPKNQEAVISL